MSAFSLAKATEESMGDKKSQRRSEKGCRYIVKIHLSVSRRTKVGCQKNYAEEDPDPALPSTILYEGQRAEGHDCWTTITEC